MFEWISRLVDSSVGCVARIGPRDSGGRPSVSVDEIGVGVIWVAHAGFIRFNYILFDGGR